LIHFYKRDVPASLERAGEAIFQKELSISR